MTKLIDCKNCAGSGEIFTNPDYIICPVCEGERRVEEMQVELITFNAAGQGTINFESLEALTSSSFAGRVLSFVDDDYVYVDHHDGKYMFTVYLDKNISNFGTEKGYIVANYFYHTCEFSIDLFSYYDLKKFGIDVPADPRGKFDFDSLDFDGALEDVKSVLASKREFLGRATYSADSLPVLALIDDIEEGIRKYQKVALYLGRLKRGQNYV